MHKKILNIQEKRKEKTNLNWLNCKTCILQKKSIQGEGEEDWLSLSLF